MTFLTFFQQIVQQDLDFLGKTFGETQNQLNSLLFDEFNRKIAQKQLYCQSRDRSSDVQKTDKRILQVIPSDLNLKKN
jgi:hypothetical protein